MKSNGDFCSAFNVNARLKCSMQQLRGRMENNAALKLVGRGTHLSYEVIGAPDKQLLELRQDGIRFIFHFSKPTDMVFSAGLMRLLAILAMVDGLYDIRLDAIYSYVIDALARHYPIYELEGRDSRIIRRLSKEVEALTFANSRLAHDIYGAIQAKNELAGELDACKEFCAKVMDAMARRDKDAPVSIGRAFGIDAELVGRVSAIVRGGK